MTKMTKKAMFTALLSILETSDHPEKAALVDGLEHEIELLDRKSENRKPSKAQQKGEEVRNHVLEVLENAVAGLTVKEIWKADEWFINNDVATQSITAQLKKMVSENLVENVKDKKTSLYMIA